MNRESVSAGKEIHRQTGRTFYLATRLLPSRVREATYVLYGFFRIADEVVDDGTSRPPGEQRRRLESLRDQALGRADNAEPILEAFSALRSEYGIADEEVHAFVDAMQADIETDRYETAAELDAYMRGSAAAVGVMMTAIMQPDDQEQALPHARALGTAFQLTNFLRDVREDVLDRDRIYLPRETLRAHGGSVGQIERLEPSAELERAVAFELDRAESLYRDGVAGIRYLPADCQFPVLLAAVLYAEHHAMIRNQGYDVLSSRPTLSMVRMGSCLVRTRWHWFWNRDPEQVFYRASAVSRPDTGEVDRRRSLEDGTLSDGHTHSS